MVEQQEATAAAVTITQRSWGRGNREWTFRGADREAVQEAALAHYGMLDDWLREPSLPQTYPCREGWAASVVCWGAA
jgi:hypothetical protein